jgi:hypothetical protein
MHRFIFFFSVLNRFRYKLHSSSAHLSIQPFPFGHVRVLWLRLTSVHQPVPLAFLLCNRFAPKAFAHALGGLTHRSLRVRFHAFHSCSPPIYVYMPRAVLGFRFFGSVTRIYPPRMEFLFVGSNVCRRLPSDSTSQWTPLP